MSEFNELTKKETEQLAEQEAVHGFEDTRPEDIIIPRIKVINALSPERIDGIANEGAIINGLTQEDVADKRFIPIKQYYSNIYWNPDRDAEQRMFCRSFDGRIGTDDDGSHACDKCGKCRFDNTKTGKDAQPLCTAYINFLGYFEGNPMPVVLSFAKTNYNEGKKLLSIARSMRTSIWNYAYTLSSKQISKGKNRWFIVVPQMVNETTPEERALAFEIFKAYEKININTNYEDMGDYNNSTTEVDAEIAAEI